MYKCCRVQIFFFSFVCMLNVVDTLWWYLCDTQLGDYVAVHSSHWNYLRTHKSRKHLKNNPQILFSAEPSRFLCGHLATRLVPSKSQPAAILLVASWCLAVVYLLNLFLKSFFLHMRWKKKFSLWLKTVFCFDTALLWYFIVLCLRHKSAEKLFNFLPQKVLQPLYMNCCSQGVIHIAAISCSLCRPLAYLCLPRGVAHESKTENLQTLSWLCVAPPQQPTSRDSLYIYIVYLVPQRVIHYNCRCDIC